VTEIRLLCFRFHLPPLILLIPGDYGTQESTEGPQGLFRVQGIKILFGTLEGQAAPAQAVGICRLYNLELDLFGLESRRSICFPVRRLSLAMSVYSFKFWSVVWVLLHTHCDILDAQKKQHRSKSSRGAGLERYFVIVSMNLQFVFLKVHLRIQFYTPIINRKERR